MKVLWLDCQAGAAGDMILAALVDAGAPLEAIREGVGALLPGIPLSLEAERVDRCGVSALHLRVAAPDQHHHRTFREIAAMIGDSHLPAPVREVALGIFRCLARAEGKIHALPPDDVHFHEVGALDSIVDVVGVSIALHFLGVERIHVSPLPLGRGFVQSGHGLLPLPAPAALELLRGFTLVATDRSGELVTPTGASIVASLAASAPPPPFAPSAIGYGAGSRDDPHVPNVVRAVLGDDGAGIGRDVITLLSANLDDSTPESLGFLMELLLEGGALDVTFTPLQMKKNRPGVLVSVMVPPRDEKRLAELLLFHTTTLGVRMERMERMVLPRSIETVRTPWGEVRVKVARLGEMVRIAPEYDDCARIARERNLPLTQVMERVRQGYGS